MFLKLVLPTYIVCYNTVLVLHEVQKYLRNSYSDLLKGI